MTDLSPTDAYPELLRYTKMAHTLQEANINSLCGRNTDVVLVNDPLCQFVTIYDVIERHYAGFSNALQQVRLGSYNPKRWQARPYFDRVWMDLEDWLYVFLVHRITGSGASFASDHGFRNNVIHNLVHARAHPAESGVSYLAKMADWVYHQMTQGPVFTSIGNQIPAFPKEFPEPYRRGSEYYLHDLAPRFCRDLVRMFDVRAMTFGPEAYTINSLVDEVLRWHREHVGRQYKFVLTAFVMDIAEYYPAFVDPHSHCYFGANAERCAEVMFVRPKRMRKEDFHNAVIDRFRDDVKKLIPTTPAYPMSLEDVLCDAVRWMRNYIPKGYEHLKPWQIESTAPPLLPKHQSYHDHLDRHAHVS